MDPHEIREAIHTQHSRLPAVDHNGKPLAIQPENPELFASQLAAVRDDETWQKMGPGWPQMKRRFEAIAAGVPVPTVEPELDGNLTEAEREVAVAQLEAAIAAAQAGMATAGAEPVQQGPRVPRPDLSQGGSGGGGGGVDAHIAEASKKGDWKTVIGLQRQKVNPFGRRSQA